MKQKVLINGYPIQALSIQKTTLKDGRIKVSLEFEVASEEYHDVTTLLYKNDFIVKVPDEHLEFPAVISNYSTSITNLYEQGAIGEFKLELIEKE